MTRFFKLTLFMMLITGYCSAQQYPVFTQYFFNELVINPAFAGAHVQFSASAIYRNQWVNFPGAPRTFSVSAHTALMKNKIGVGLLVNHDEIGSYGNDNIYASYAYKIHFQNSTLSMGLQAGVNLLGADYSKLNLKDPLDQDASFAPIRDFKPNFGAGLYYNKKNWFLGFSVPFILNNKLDDQGFESALAQVIERRYYMLRSGIVFPINRQGTVKMNPSFLLRSQEGQPLSLDINNAFIFYDIFSAGLAWRSGEKFGDSFITFLDLKLTDKLHFSYSFDWTTSDINRFTSGSHEFMLNFRSIFRGIHKNPECPQYYEYR
jgi:type IX secretion system PorP/SprF family membrane protein